MLNRRTLLHHGARSLSSAALASLPCLRAFAQQATPPHTDEMTQNTSQTRQTFPQPDFGPTPTVLPKETLALRGPNSLKAHAQSHGILTGAALVSNVLAADPALQELVADQYSLLVPESELKWGVLRPAQDRFDYSAAETLLTFAPAHRLQLRGHTLVWHQSVTTWLTTLPDSTDVRAILVDHIRQVVGHFRGHLHSWDVVNEAILPSDKQRGSLRKSFWYDRVSPSYIDPAFNTAHEADPNVPLAYNDYGVEYDDGDNEQRRRAILDLLDLLRGLQSRAVPIHAVGIQAHLKAGFLAPVGKGLTDYIEAIRQLGLAVYIAKLDVNEDDIAAPDVPTRDAAIALAYRKFMDVVLPNPAVKLVLTWGVSSRRTWLNDGPTHHRKQPDRPQRSLPFDPAYRPTPAFFALRDSFDARPQTHT